MAARDELSSCHLPSLWMQGRKAPWRAVELSVVGLKGVEQRSGES